MESISKTNSLNSRGPNIVEFDIEIGGKVIEKWSIPAKKILKFEGNDQSKEFTDENIQQAIKDHCEWLESSVNVTGRLK